MAIEKIKYKDLLRELTDLLEKTKTQVVFQINSSITILFWHIGKRILTEELNNKRVKYGKQIVVTLSRELVDAHIVKHLFNYGIFN